MKLLKISFVILALGIVGVGCRHTPAPHLTEYGQAGSGKISIVVGGYVEQPGRYFVDGGTTIETITTLSGGIRACPTCGRKPTSVIVYSKGNNDGKQRYFLADLEQLRSVKLHDGDILKFPVIHF